jgi:hypothetical protein
MKILFILASLMMNSVWAQDSFSVTQKNQNILKALDKNKKQIFTFVVKNTTKNLNDVDTQFVRMKDEYCKLLPVKSIMLKSQQSTQVSISCDLSKVSGDMLVFDRKFKIRLNSTDVVDAEIKTSLYDPQTRTLENDTCNHPWRAKCKNEPKELLSLCFVASGHYMDTKASLDYGDCKKGARQIRAKNIEEVQDALANIYNNQCGVVQNVQLLNPKTLFGYENEEWETADLMRDKNLACLYTQNASIQFKGSDLEDDCASDIYKMKLARQFNPSLSHANIAKSLIKNCQKACVEKNKNTTVDLCDRNAAVKNIVDLKEANSCENFTTVDQFLAIEKSL